MTSPFDDPVGWRRMPKRKVLHFVIEVSKVWRTPNEASILTACRQCGSHPPEAIESQTGPFTERKCEQCVAELLMLQPPYFRKRAEREWGGLLETYLLERRRRYRQYLDGKLKLEEGHN